MFMVTLILTLPIYTANALAASLSITKNYGEDQINQFLDGQGDVWTVEATITGLPDDLTVEPAEVKLKVGNNQAEFQSCGSTALGTACQYVSPLTDGIAEGEYRFQVVYDYINELGNPAPVSDADVIKSDLQGPAIEITHLEQGTEPGQVELDFTVNDKPSGAPSVGIKTIEIADADGGSVRQVINFPEPGVEQYRYSRDSGFGGILQSTFDGEGRKRVRVSAEDWLGHPARLEAVAVFDSDFVVPLIQDNLEFPELGEFIGQVRVTSQMTVDVLETELDKITATAEGTSLRETRGLCSLDEEEDNLWHCSWADVEIDPSSTLSITFRAEDEKGNLAERTLSKSFTVDEAPPVVEFLGTMNTYQDQSYVRSGEQLIILKATDAGAGIDQSGIVPNLDALGGVRSSQCNETAGEFVCRWKTSRAFTSDGVARIGLTVFQDKVGNRGEAPLVELMVDTFGPKVEKMEVYGVSQAGEKDYFQSNDIIRIKLEAIESSGVAVLVNLNGLVMDASELFPETEGWLRVTDEEACQRQEGKWLCQVDTPPIMSGPDNSVALEIKVQDTAGNDAQPGWAPALNMEGQDGDYHFELLGLIDEEQPDYWEVEGVNLLNDFVDLSSTHLAPLRMPVAVKLESLNAQAINLELDDCSGGEEAPGLRRSLLYGRSFETAGEANPTILLEFEPFDGRSFFNVNESEETVHYPKNYTCQLRIFSQVDRKAVANAEVQQVSFDVNFALSALGAQDDALKDKIEDAHDLSTKWYWTWTDEAKWVLDVINFINNIFFRPLLQIMKLFDVVKISMAPKQKTPLYQVITASCGSLSAFQYSSYFVYDILQPVMAVLTCGGTSPHYPKNPNDQPKFNNAYTQWQDKVLDWYNINLGTRWGEAVVTGLYTNPTRARSLHDNILVSAVGICLPGIIYNLHKLREIWCRYEYCLKNEVSQGMPVSVCEDMKSMMTCKYFTGELLEMAPFVGGIFGLLDALKALLSDLVGTGLKVIYWGCTTWCPVDTAGAGFCSLTVFLSELFSMYDTIASAWQGKSGIGQSYCDLIED